MIVHIVEDDASVRDAIAVFTHQLGMDPKGYADAESFFESGSPAPSDTVIVDLGLPGIDGTTVIKWLNALDEPPRIIAISGQPQTALYDVMRELPSVRIVRKPLTDKSLASFL